MPCLVAAGKPDPLRAAQEGQVAIVAGVQGTQLLVTSKVVGVGPVGVETREDHPNFGGEFFKAWIP